MTFHEFVKTITEAELDFIARLDYGQDFEAHRQALDEVLANNGIVDTTKHGVWFPLEVVELGRNWLQIGHEREFALCMGIVLSTGAYGDEAEVVFDSQIEVIESLPENLREMLEEMVMQSIK